MLAILYQLLTYSASHCNSTRNRIKVLNKALVRRSQDFAARKFWIVRKNSKIQFLKHFLFFLKTMQNERSFDSWLSIWQDSWNLARFLLWSYCPECSWPIRLQHFVKPNNCKKLRDQADFLFSDKHQSFLPVSAIAFGGRGQVYPEYPR